MVAMVVVTQMRGVIASTCGNVHQSSMLELEGQQIPLEKSLWPWTITAIHNNKNNTNDTCMDTNTPNTSNVTYYLNGAGLRSFSLFHGWGGNIKIYIAALYRTTLVPLNTTESIYTMIQKNRSNSIIDQQRNTAMSDSGIDSHLLFEFTFLRHVKQRHVTEAWKYQLHHSISKEYSLYPEYPHDYKTFIQAFGPINTGGTVSVALSPDGHTHLFDSGYHCKGTIVGDRFQLAFASMWVGPDPVTVDLKNSLLGNYNSSCPSFHL